MEFRGFSLCVVPMALVVGTVTVVAAGPLPQTIAGWNAYVAAVEQRRTNEMAAGEGFLALDCQPASLDERRQVEGGAIVVRPGAVAGWQAEPIAVPDGLVHHWRGAVLVRGVDAPTLLARIEDADPPAVQEDVARSAIVARGDGWEDVSLRLERRKIVTAVYDTEHRVTFDRISATRAASASRSVRIVELDAPGTPRERERAAGEDRGLLWRLNAYWRYETVPGGTIAECESLSLSRDVPWLLRPLLANVIESTARDSMERMLSALRSRFEASR